MKRPMTTFIFLLSLSFLLFQPSDGLTQQKERQKYKAEYAAGNYLEAFEGLKKLLLDSSIAPESGDLNTAVICLNSLNRESEFDTFIEETISKHPNDPTLLAEAAMLYRSSIHHGVIVAGKFQRGYSRATGNNYANADDRDRVRSIQLLLQAIKNAAGNRDNNTLAGFYNDLAEAIRHGRASWQLQALTDISKLPDYQEDFYYSSNSNGAPVDGNGEPVLYKIPESFESARSDGERFRFALSKVAEIAPERTDSVKVTWAAFLESQFGTPTLARGGFGRYAFDDSDETSAAPSTYSLHTLTDEETLAQLATGPKRFKLADEYNPIKIYLSIEKGSYRVTALRALANIFQNRRQFPRAAQYWKSAYDESKDESDKRQLDQIVGAWGRFDPVVAQTAGQDAAIEYRFRNGTSVSIAAYEVNIEKLLDDTFSYLKSQPKDLDYSKLNISNYGYRLLDNNQGTYATKKIAEWQVKLEPRANHLDKRVTITPPFKSAGTYLLIANIGGGNTSRILLTLNDTVVVKKPLDKKVYYYIADALSGAPLKNATVKFFGYNYAYTSVPVLGRYAQVKTQTVDLKTNEKGEIIADSSVLDQEFTWALHTKRESGNVTFLGFSNFWYPNIYDAEYNQTKAYIITDRPVYRPDQTVKFKIWVRNARYDDSGDTSREPAKYEVEITNPRSEKILEKTFQSDQYGGFDGEISLPKDAALGEYMIYVKGLNTGEFRVEEYKKPEFEVKIDAPTDPISLGDAFKAKITAKYYFGAPVTSAKVKVKIQRYEHTSSWFPIGKWDWLYGTGYWWFSYDYVWFPGWAEWGCKMPFRWWWYRSPNPPELIADYETEIGKDGTIEAPIDTSIAKELYGKSDHRYAISVEVTDQSRRTIYASGDVLVARKPFKVYAWVDRGYYQSGDVIEANFKAQRLDGKPVSGKGNLKLLAVNYKSGSDTPEEKEVQRWDLDTDAQGESRLQLKAASAGQYRLAYEVTDSANHKIEGGYLFTVYGDGFKSGEYRFNDIEVIADKREYAAGEKAKLLINTNHIGSNVLVFLRPTNGVYQKPDHLVLKEKSSNFSVEISKKDMPNFFVEVVTVAKGKVYSEMRELHVPPESRALDVQVTSNKEEYKPDEEVELLVKVLDMHGKPFSGSTVISVYDRSIDYIAGGANISEIKEYFWKWRRSHRIDTQSNTLGYSQEIHPATEPWMRAIGAFGDTIADEQEYDMAFSERQQRSDARMMKSTMIASVDGVGGAGGGFADMALPASAPMEMQAAKMQGAKDKNEVAQSFEALEEAAPVNVRKEFADTAFWAANITTAADGTARVKFKAPQNLTSWSVRSWAMGTRTQVGEGKKEITTSKKLLVRLQAPRFFVEKDEVVISANVHNYLPTKKDVKASIKLDGGSIELLDQIEKQISVDTNGELRVDWRVRVVKEGEAIIQVSALSDEESDAMEMKFPVYVHGMLKTESWSGNIRPQGETGSLEFTVPAERREAESRLEIRYSPTLAGAMVDALPYLVDYPYGCTEQTLSRFLPTVITQKVLKDMKLNLSAIKEKRTNLNAQEIGDDKSRATQWKRLERNPVFDEAEVNRMARAGLERLISMQLSNGGWGWFSGSGEYASAHTTAHVVHGLQVAKSLGMEFDYSSIDRGIDWLSHYQAEEIQKIKNAPLKVGDYKEKADDMDAFVEMVLSDSERGSKEMREFLYRDRTSLAVYSKAALGLALSKNNDKEKLAMIMRNISQYIVEDNENQTAYLNLGNQNYWWYWYGNEYEAHAYYLKLLAKVEPKSEIAPKLVKYLLNNRKNSTYWNSTRDTALIVEAFADYLKAAEEHTPDMTLEIFIDGKKQKEVRLTGDNLFTFDNRLVLQGKELESGKHKIEFKKKGKGALYFNAYLTNFTLEDFITKAGLEIKVNRKYYKLIEADDTTIAQGAHGQVVEAKRDRYTRMELANLSDVKSGDLVEIELEIDSKNDYEYLIFEDMKAAGFEPLEVRSGYNGNAMNAYVEFRDERVAFFVRTLARGKHSVSYRMKAEIPGKFSALPTRAYAMYAPELKANSDELKLSVHD